MDERQQEVREEKFDYRGVETKIREALSKDHLDKLTTQDDLKKRIDEVANIFLQAIADGAKIDILSIYLKLAFSEFYIKKYGDPSLNIIQKHLAIGGFDILTKIFARIMTKMQKKSAAAPAPVEKIAGETGAKIEGEWEGGGTD